MDAGGQGGHLMEFLAENKSGALSLETQAMSTEQGFQQAETGTSHSSPGIC